MPTPQSITEEKRLCPACIKNLPGNLFKGKFCMMCVVLKGVRDAPEEAPQSRIDLLLRKYGMTVIDYRRIYDRQAGRCGICSESRSWDHKVGALPFVVDHDHSTGNVRGLLCGQCNSGLGFFRDNRDSLVRAVTYLDRASGKKGRPVNRPRKPYYFYD